MEKVGNAYVYYQSIHEDRVALVQTLCNALMIFPHLRLGQLINNVRQTDPEIKGYSDEFYIPDNKLCAALKRYISEHATQEQNNEQG